MSLLTKIKQKFLTILSGLTIVAASLFFEITQDPALATVRDRLNSLIYDIRLQFNILGKLPIGVNQTDVVIVDIDEKSLKEEGRWPWSRDKVGLLLQKLREDGAVVIAFDVVFAEPERNLGDDLLQELHQDGVNNSLLTQEISRYHSQLDNDREFAEILAKQNDVVLGFILNEDPTLMIGQLPPPILVLSEEESGRSDLFDFPGQIANIPMLQTSAQHGGFVTSISDSDGIIRHAPLVIEHKMGVYPSLGLAAAMKFYYIDQLDLNFVPLKDGLALTHIQLGKEMIPTDPFGQVLVPFRGKSHSFPYFSASDILKDGINPDNIKNKIVFIGASAIGLGDLHPTPFQTSFPGVEIHATVADAILQGSFASIPDWALGAKVFILFIVGVLLAFLLPFLSLAWIMTVPVLISALIAGSSIWMFSHKNIYLSTITLYAMQLGLLMVNLIHALIFETRKRLQLKEMFGQYVPPAHVEKMTESGMKYSFEGESRDMSVLFADIRNFTSICEKLNPAQIKILLNEYFTPMTKVIFDNGGTIDKYVGDMIMAFWGAPLENTHHAFDAVKAGFAMLEMAQSMKGHFKDIGIDEIHIGVGINSGFMSVGDMGSTYRRSYTVLGDAVNLASRLESSTKFYHSDFIISKKTLEDCEDKVIARHLDRVRVIGKEEAIEIYEPICLREQVTEAILEQITRQTEAEKYYYDAAWDEALVAYQMLHEDYPHCELYPLYIDRIQELKAKKIQGPWDGCYVRVTK